jgi:hypothetical protein
MSDITVTTITTRTIMSTGHGSLRVSEDPPGFLVITGGSADWSEVRTFR